jgi:hypothetical protein
VAEKLASPTSAAPVPDTRARSSVRVGRLLPFGLAILCAVPVSGQLAPPGPTAPAATAPSGVGLLPSADRLSELATTLLRQLAPSEHANNKKWGGTKEVFDGVKVYRDGFKIKTRRRKKTVNHGLWKRYEVKLIEPEKHLTVRIERLVETEPGRLRFDLVVVAKLDLLGQIVQWQRGLRLLSLTAEADAKVRARLTCELSARLDPTRIPPDVVLDAVARDVQLELLEFQLHRISDLGGKPARELGRFLREAIDDELAQKRPKLLAKVNEKIEKNRDKLRFSLRDLIPKQLSNLGTPAEAAEDAEPGSPK